MAKKSQGELTETGIFSGGEKYLASDFAASEKAKDDIMSEGMTILQKDSLGKSAANQSKDFSSSPQNIDNEKFQWINNELGNIDTIGDDKFLDWVDHNDERKLSSPKQTEISVPGEILTTAVLSILSKVPEKREKLESEDYSLKSSRKSSLQGSSRGSSITSLDSIGQSRSRSNSGELMHKLHLDFSARKKEKKQKEETAAQLKEAEDMQRWEEKIKTRYLEREKRRAQKRAERDAKRNLDRIKSGEEVS